MSVRNFSKDVLLVTLPREPHLGNELEEANEIASDKRNCNVLVDFSGAELLTSASICNLMILHKLLNGLGYQLVLCNVPFLIKCTFTVTGLEGFFKFTNDISDALECLQRIC